MKSIDEGIVCIINELLLHHATIKQFKKSDTGYYLQKLNFINTAITEQIKSLCFQARDKWVLERIEDLDAYDGIYDQGEDDYGRHHSKNMGDAVLIDDIRKIFKDVLNIEGE